MDEEGILVEGEIRGSSKALEVGKYLEEVKNEESSKKFIKRKGESSEKVTSTKRK